MTTQHLSIYKIGLLVAILVWYFEQIGLFPAIFPDWNFGGINWGFWFIIASMVVLTYCLVAYLEQVFFGNDLPRWLTQLRRNQGTSRYMDIILLGVVFFSFFGALAARTLSTYLVLVMLFTVLGAIQSLLGDRELHLPRPKPVAQVSDGEGKDAFADFMRQLRQQEPDTSAPDVKTDDIPDQPTGMDELDDAIGVGDTTADNTDMGSDADTVPNDSTEGVFDNERVDEEVDQG